MANLKSLAKDTAIYGLSSIIGRFLNYLLFPLYTTRFVAESGEYGVITHIYSMTALLMVLLVYGMETGFFRFANKEGENESTVYSTILISVGSTSLLFVLLCLAFLNPVSSFLGYADNPEFIGMMAVVVALDAFQSIPFARLRQQKRPIKFVSVKLFTIFVNIGLNLFFLVLCPWVHARNPELVSWFYNPSYGLGYVFVSNLISSSLQMLILVPEMRGFPYVFDRGLMKRIFRYSFPLLILGVIGVFNQTVDRIIYIYLFDDPEVAKAQLGIYGAATKLAMIMALLTQAFRYAYEPFVFGENKERDSRATYAAAMKYYVIFALLAFLGVMFYMDILCYLMGKSYRVGLHVVPIVMGAEILMGVYFNLSFWYKLTDQTKWGAWLSLIGCAVIVTLNVAFVPVYGYIASAWAGLTGYLVITLISYAMGQRKYPIAYDLKGIGMYVLLAALLYVVSLLVVPGHVVLRLGFRTVLLLAFIAFIIKKDLPVRQIPVLNRLLKK